jgi:Ca-activated chloride channel family protein
MKSKVELDGLLVHTHLRQVFQNHTSQELEGRYLYRLPDGGSLSDFAIWEDGVRIPGVVVERRRAQEIYEELTSQKIDPGLLEMGDPEGENLGIFSARVYPIPAYGTKRIEIEYQQELSLVARQARFQLPLAATRYARQSVGQFEVDLRFRPPYPLKSYALESANLGALTQDGEGTLKLHHEASRKALTEDLAFHFEVQPPANPWRLLAYRDPRLQHSYEVFSGGAQQDLRGTLLMRYLIPEAPATTRPPRPRNFLFLADLSLSVRWEKLEKMVAALRFFLSSLEAGDRFSLGVFRQDAPELLAIKRPGTSGESEAALKRLAEQALEGATNLQAAAAFSGKWLRQQSGPALAILLSDGHPTWGETDFQAIVTALGDPGENRHLATLGIGDGAREDLLGDLATRGKGIYQKLEEVGNPDFVLKTFWTRLFQAPVEKVRLEFPEGAGIEDIYRAGHGPASAGSSLRFVARFREPGEPISATLHYVQQGEEKTVPVNLPRPGHDLEHPQLPRFWAQSRVEFLLERMERRGENETDIQEIIRLAKKFKLATPYTSFLAAPRALLRPRRIKPGDPILRVKVGPEIRLVVARLPWGELLRLRRLEDEGVFETRFLAPSWVKEGRYQVRLLLTDRQGERSMLEEHFFLDGTPPTVRVAGKLPVVHPGDRLALAVYADADTRHLTARLAGGAPVFLHYCSEGAVSRGEIPIPDLPPGRHRLVLEAEDFAHNRSSQVLLLEVQG